MMIKDHTYYIASDHGGFDLKQQLLESQDFHFTDLGPDSKTPCHYPNYAKKLAQIVQADSNAFGALICRSGTGMAIAANRFQGVRALSSWCPEIIERARQHNHINVLCLGADYVDLPLALQCLKVFFNTTADQDQRHLERLKLLENNS